MSLIPRALLGAVRRIRARRRMRRYAHLSLGQTFDDIYLRGVWGDPLLEPSGGGSYGNAAEAYVAFVRDFIAERGIRSICDIGCGDFNVGAQLAPSVERYEALDVSAEIVHRSRERHASLRNVTFRVADATRDALPRADLVTVRQVLQHLTNAQIAQVLAGIEAAGFRYALITEHAPARLMRANVDLPSQAAETRAMLGSAVILAAAPFSRIAHVAERIPLSSNELGEHLEVWSWEPRR